MKLSLCMIVRDEARWIAQCLDSVAGLASEIIVVDTGSKDGTPEIAKSRGAKVFPLEWPDDFSKARNYSLERANGDWILVLDADEVIAKKDHAVIRKLMEAPGALQYSLIQTNYSPESTVFGWQKNYLEAPEAQGFPGYIESPLVRLFRNIPEIRYEGAVHEHACHAGRLPPVRTELRVHHYGKYSDPQRIQEKYRMYSRLGEEKIRENPNDAHAWYELGVQYMLMEQSEKAWSALLESEKLNPEAVQPQLAMAGLACKEENAQEAIQRFSKIMCLNPKNVQPYIHLPSLLAKQNQFRMAEEIMALGEAYAGGHPIYHINSGVVWMLMGNYRRAITGFKEAIRLNAKEAIAWLNLGIAHMGLKEWDEAHAALDRSLNFEVTRLKALKKKAECYYNIRNFHEAEKWILDACDEFPEDPEVFYQKAIIKIQLGDMSGARQALEKIRDYGIFNPQELKNLIQCHLTVGNEKEADALKTRSQLH